MKIDVDEKSVFGGWMKGIATLAVAAAAMTTSCGLLGLRPVVGAAA